MSSLLCFGSVKTKSPAELGLLQERVYSLLEARCRLAVERPRRRRVRKAIAVAMPSAPKKKIKPKPPEDIESWPGLAASLEKVKRVKGVVDSCRK